MEAAETIKTTEAVIQTGVETRDFHEYVTKSWKHLLPLRERMSNLNRIAKLVQAYDLVGLQEVDSGSLRTGFLDQTEYLAHHARFPYWYKQVNRSLGKIAQQSNGMLSRIEPRAVNDIVSRCSCVLCTWHLENVRVRASWPISVN